MSARRGDLGEKNLSKYLFLLFFLGVLVIAFLIVRPFISTLVISALVAYLLNPVYVRFVSFTHMKRFSAVIALLLLLLLASIPVVIVVGELTNEAYGVYVSVKQVFLEQGSGGGCGSGSLLCGFYSLVSSISEKYGIDLGSRVGEAASGLASVLMLRVSGFIMDIPLFLLNILVGVFAVYYMLVQGEEMVASFSSALPMARHESERIVSKFKDIIRSAVYGAIVVALLQGLIAGVGYFIFGVESPVLLSLFTLVAAFVPFIGATLVWLPVSVSMLASGLLGGDSSLVMRAIGLLIYGTLLVSTIDNLIRPRIMGSGAKVHPLVMLLGVFGGIVLFGFVGVIVGPLLLTLFTASLKIYVQEKHNMF
jgi:predicted PurR-regulated permease PerM